METDTTQATMAERELRTILDTIAAEDGTTVARETARTLLVAVEEGRIDGSDYGVSEDYNARCEMVKVPVARFEGCIAGHLAQLRDSWSYGTPDIPVWTDGHNDTGGLSYLERFIIDVRPEQTPATSPVLADLHTWLTSILAV